MFLPREVTVDGIATTYRVYEPPDVGGRLPVILFLHGAGESGSDGVKPTTVGIGAAIKKKPERFPALVVFPQASRGYGWRGFNLKAAVAAVDDVAQQYDVDGDRTYITGISMGGYGTSAITMLQPARFAAAVPICGGLDRAAGAVGAALPTIPQWVFHGDIDDIIPVEESRVMVKALRAAGAEVQYTEYSGVAHNSWDRAYAEPELMPWLLAQRK